MVELMIPEGVQPVNRSYKVLERKCERDPKKPYPDTGHSWSCPIS